MSIRSLTPLVLLLTFSVALTGCVKFKQLLTVNPDGSGTMQLTVAMSEQVLAMAGPEQDPFAEFSIDEMIEEEDNGFVAFTEPTIENKNGYKTMTVTGYFEDINELKFEGGGDGEEDGMDDGEKAEPTTYTFDTDGTLTIHRPMLGQMAAQMDNEEMDLSDPNMRAMMAPMLQGMEISEAVVVPGAVTESGFLNAQGSQASFSITADMLLANDTAAIDQLKGTDEVAVQFDPAGWEGGAEAAWEAELAEAKAKWAKLKEQAAVGAP